jgi:hypothetical protein
VHDTRSPRPAKGPRPAPSRGGRAIHALAASLAHGATSRALSRHSASPSASSRASAPGVASRAASKYRPLTPASDGFVATNTEVTAPRSTLVPPPPKPARSSLVPTTPGCSAFAVTRRGSSRRASARANSTLASFERAYAS